MNPINVPPFPKNSYLVQSKLRQFFEKAPEGSINLGIGQPAEDTPTFIREAAQKVVLEKNLGYTLNAGIGSLREKIATSFNSPLIQTSSICLTAGVQEALYALFYTLLSPQTEILLPDPGFLTYPSLAGLMGCTPRYYHLRKEQNFRFSAQAVIDQLRPETKVLLIAHPSNPTGSDAPEEEYKILIDYLRTYRRDHPVWVISDEVYFGMNYFGSSSTLASYLEEYPWIIVLRGASKSHHMTGWRLAWMTLPEPLQKPVIASHQYLCTCANAVAQHTLDSIWGTPEEAEWNLQRKALYRKKRDKVEQLLSPHVPLFGGEGAFYWMIDISQRLTHNQTDEDFAWNLLFKDKVITVPGSAFGNQTKGMLRLSYGAKMEQLEEGLQRLLPQPS